MKRPIVVIPAVLLAFALAFLALRALDDDLDKPGGHYDQAAKKQDVRPREPASR